MARRHSPRGSAEHDSVCYPATCCTLRSSISIARAALRQCLCSAVVISTRHSCASPWPPQPSSYTRRLPLIASSFQGLDTMHACAARLDLQDSMLDMELTCNLGNFRAQTRLSPPLIISGHHTLKDKSTISSNDIRRRTTRRRNVFVDSSISHDPLLRRLANLRHNLTTDSSLAQECLDGLDR